MKQALGKKARRAASPVAAKRLPRARAGAKTLSGKKMIAKPIPGARAHEAPPGTGPRPLLKPLRALQPHLSGAPGHPRPTPTVL